MVSTKNAGVGGRVCDAQVPVAACSNRERREANLVDLVARETFHVLGRIVGDARGQDEYYAYYAGLCARLAVLGPIPESAWPGVPLQGAWMNQRGHLRIRRIGRGVRPCCCPAMAAEHSLCAASNCRRWQRGQISIAARTDRNAPSDALTEGLGRTT